MSQEFKTQLRGRQKLIGTMVTIGAPSVAEILSSCGFDWLFVDGEHGPLETDALLGILQAAGHRVPCIVRVPAPEEVPIKKVLDLGAAGIIAPQVNTVAQAEHVVRSALYAPTGARGVGLARAHGYGLEFEDYVKHANDRVSVIVQAEHATAVDNIEQIAQVEGIDAVLIGPYDLAASLGRMGDVNHPDVTSAIDRVTEVCLERKLALGIFGVTPDAITPYVDRGYSLIVAGVDTLLLAHSARRMRAAFE